jgi:uncharacterized protein (TIGR02266 family)
LATTNTRTANRSPVTLKIKFKSETLNQFIERYSVDISHGGIFIRTKDPLPVGTALRFEFQLKDASPLITGDGTVVWTREFDPTRSGVAPGMGVRFDRLPSESQEILEQILAYKSAKLGGDNGSEVPAFLDVPTKVAQVGPGGQPVTGATPFGEVPTRVTPAHVLKSLQQGDDPRRTLIGIGMSQLKSNGATESDKTPLPRPLPFHADLDEFPDEAFEEATKVAELEALAKKSAEDQDSYGASMDDDVTMQRSKRPTAPAPEAMAQVAAASAMASTGELAAGKFQSVAAFDRAMRSGSDDDEDEGGFAHSNQVASAAAAAQAPAAEYRPAPAMIAPHHEDVERDGGSSLPWIIAAAIVLVVASIGGFLLLNGKEDEKKDKQPEAPVAAQRKQAVTPPTQPTPVPPQEPVKPGLEAVVTSVPEGAMAELVGEGQSGTTPMTFRGLEKGKKYTVRLSNAGFVDKETSFEAGGDAPKAVELLAKPVVLKVTSTPPGAAVFIDGQKQKGATPASITLAGKLAGKKQLKVSVRRSGYNNADQDVALDQLVDGGASMTQEVAVTLVKRASRPSGGGKTGGGSGTAGSGASDKPPDGAGDKPPDGAGDKPPDGAGDKPPDGAGDKPPDGAGAKPPEKPADKPAEKPADKSGMAPKEGGGAKAASSAEPTPEWSK